MNVNFAPFKGPFLPSISL